MHYNIDDNQVPESGNAERKQKLVGLENALIKGHWTIFSFFFFFWARFHLSGKN